MRNSAPALVNSLKAEKLFMRPMLHDGRYVNYEYKKHKYV